MAFLAVQHALQGSSGLSEDRFVNTFHLQGTGDPTEAQLTAIKDALVAFYSNLGGAFNLGQYLADTAAGVGRTVKIYDHQDVKPRAPIYEFVDTDTPFALNSTTAYPSEVAMCISFAAPKLSGQVQARRRGRIYLGPLNVSAGSSGDVTFQECRPQSQFMSSCMTTFGKLMTDFAAANHILSVYSPTVDTSDTGVVGAFSVVETWWTDDAFDTQRRRGVRPLTRQTRQVAG